MNAPATSAAEQAVLGAALLRASTIDEAIDAGLEPGDFGEPAHRLVWEAAAALHAERQPVDMVTLPERLGTSLDHHGGLRLLADLTAACPSVRSIDTYVEIVRSAALGRSLAHVADEIRHAAAGRPEDALALLEQRCGELRRRSGKREDWRHISDVLTETFDAMQARSRSPNDLVGLPTGLTDLDAILAGLHGGDLIILAARPSMGKSALALGISVAAARTGAGVAFFSLEMSSESLGSRTLSSEARVDSHRMRTGKLRQDDWPPLLAAVEGASSLPIYFDDSPDLTPSKARAAVERLMSREPVDLIVIDYITLMRGDGRFGNRQEEVSSISRELKLLAKRLDVPVIALSQLNRGVEQRADKRPLMSDLRESGAIEQDADVILFLYREEVYVKRPDNEGLAEVLVRKQRSGATGDIEVAWVGKHARFANREQDWRRTTTDETKALARQGYAAAARNRERYP